MKILVSAIACDPSGGSEGAVGWGAVSRMARKHDVRVITHENNRGGWAAAAAAGLVPGNVRVRYIGKPSRWLKNRSLARLQSWIRYLSFNRRILSVARLWHEEEPFDLAHHVTYATWRVPSPLWRLPVPFVWGPIAGGGEVPRAFRSRLSGTARLFEALRGASTFFARKSPGFRSCARRSAMVIAANEDTKRLLQDFRGRRPVRILPVAALSPSIVDCFCKPDSENVARSAELMLFAGGNIIGSKGLAYAIEALAQVKEAGIPFRYTVAGGGPDIPALRNLVDRLSLAENVVFHSGYSGEDYVKALQASEIYLLPSFREALGLTMVEAVLAGCYPVVADASTPGELVRKAGGIAIPLSSPQQFVEDLAAAVISCYQEREKLPEINRRIRDALIDVLSAERLDRELEDIYHELSAGDGKANAVSAGKLQDLPARVS